MNVTGKIIEEAVKCREVLKSGGTIIYPSDTIWGIGCDATNESAVKKIFEIKKREESKSMIVLLDAPEKLNKYLREVPAQAWDLIEYSEKPLTLVFSGAVNFAKNIIADDGTVAIRIVKNDFCIELLRRFGKPIVSTSANLSGEDAPLSFENIAENILSQVDYVVNLPLEKNKTGKPSTIIKMETNGVIKFLRK
ncbi:MAG: L-threonylcarbamoyladenylate synthase [Bacteroidota bacterium]